jgi:hypothetical protein
VAIATRRRQTADGRHRCDTNKTIRKQKKKREKESKKRREFEWILHPTRNARSCMLLKHDGKTLKASPSVWRNGEQQSNIYICTFFMYINMYIGNSSSQRLRKEISEEKSGTSAQLRRARQRKRK